MAVLKESDTNLLHDNVTLSRSAVLQSPSFSEANNHSTILKTSPCNKENKEDLQDSFKQTTARVLWNVDTYEPQNNADRQSSIYSHTEYSKETSDASEDVTNPNIAETIRQDVPDQAAVCVPNRERQNRKKRKQLRTRLINIYPIENNWGKVPDILAMIQDKELLKDGLESLWLSFKKSPDAPHLENIKEMVRKCMVVKDAIGYLEFASETILPAKVDEYFTKAGGCLDKASGNRDSILLAIRHVKDLYFQVGKKLTLILI